MSSYNVISGKEVLIDGDLLTITAPIKNGMTFEQSSVGNIGIGASALEDRTNGGRNTAVGNLAGAALTTASFNTFNGFEAGFATTSGGHNTFIGNDAGLLNTTTSQSVYVGSSAGRTNNGPDNVFIGFQAAPLASSAVDGVVIGSNAAPLMTGGQNVIIGKGGGLALTSGVSNVLISGGITAPTTGNNCILIANAGVAADSGVIRIGTTATHLKNFQAGIAGVTTDAAAVACLVSGTGQLGVTSCNVEKKKDFEMIADEDIQEFIHSMPVRKYRYKQGHNSVNVGPNVEDIRALCDKVYPDFIVKNEDGSDLGLATQHLQWIIIKDMQRIQRELDEVKGKSPKYVPDYELKGIVDDSEVAEPAFKRRRIE